MRSGTVGLFTALPSVPEDRLLTLIQDPAPSFIVMDKILHGCKLCSEPWGLTAQLDTVLLLHSLDYKGWQTSVVGALVIGVWARGSLLELKEERMPQS